MDKKKIDDSEYVEAAREMLGEYFASGDFVVFPYSAKRVEGGAWVSVDLFVEDCDES